MRNETSRFWGFSRSPSGALRAAFFCSLATAVSALSFAPGAQADAAPAGALEYSATRFQVAEPVLSFLRQAVPAGRSSGWRVRVAQVVDGDEMKWQDSFKGAPSKTFIAGDRTVRPMLAPDSANLLRDAIARYQIIVNRGGWPKVPTHSVIGASSYGWHVAVLRQRLQISGDLDPAKPRDPRRFDKALGAAVRKFQARHGLRVTGVVSGPTLAALNVSANDRLQTLQANVARIARLTRGLGEKYIVVNIPAAQIDTVEDGRVYSRHNAVVGMADRPTPILASRVTQLNFNPYWHVPVSIVKKDLLPKIRADRGILKEMKIRVTAGSYRGREIDPATVDWDNVAADRYFFRQDPGKDNAMASVRINFPNKDAVFLHDTPTKALFGKAERFFSSGCVRVEKVQIMLQWLLRDDPAWDGARIARVAASGGRLDVNLKRPVPIRLAYLTGWVTGEGTVNFRKDLYGLDARFAASLPPPSGVERTAPAPRGAPGGAGVVKAGAAQDAPAARGAEKPSGAWSGVSER